VGIVSRVSFTRCRAGLKQPQLDRIAEPSATTVREHLRLQIANRHLQIFDSPFPR
jgi:hypothetical protein